MKKTTKLFSALILIVMVLAVCLGGVACKGDDVNNYFVTYDGNRITVSGKAGETVNFPDVTRDGYFFDGWYTSEDYSGTEVTEAVFEKETTYYAKWAEVCTITLQPEGGTIKDTNLTIKQGANLLESLAEYTPEKGSLQFGGWFDGDTQITSSSVAAKGSITLTARYKAAYTVNAYMEKLDGSGYELTENYAQGYAFVDEGFFPELKPEGFSVEDENDIVISEDSSKNVFNVHFKRDVYTVSVYESYPQGGVKLSETKRVKYGQSDYLPTKYYQYEGYLMLGWTTIPGGTYSDIIGSDYVLKSDVSLYPLWEAGYSDMFSGNDYIFLMHDAENTAVILRGGLQITGKFNKLYGLYEFKNDDGKAIVRAKIDGEHFIYYATRNASYTLLEIKGLNDKISVTFDETNGVSYYNNDEGIHLVGTYEITEDGIYVATLHPSNDPDGEKTVIEFIVGTFGNTPAFRIRGEEYSYGALARRAKYYPMMTFDGFGTVTLETADQSASFTYSTDKDGIITVAYGQSDIVLKVLDYSGVRGYDFYEGDLDKTYTFAMGSPVTLTLDGCATAVFKGENETFTGTYTYKESVLFDVINENNVSRTIVTVVSDTNETRVYILYTDFIRDNDGKPVGNIPIPMFKEVGADYTERMLVDNEKKLTDSFLVVEGDGKAETWEFVDKVFTKTSEGTIESEPDNYSYTYTPKDFSETVRFKYSAITVAFSDYQYNGMDLCFALKSYDAAGKVTDYFKRYRTKGSGESSELVTASAFGIYTDATGKVFCGVLTDRTTYHILTDGTTSYYLSFDEKDDTRFYILENIPLVMYKRVDGKTDRNSTMTITWKEIGDGKYEAVYSVTDSSTKTTTNTDGYYTSQLLQFPGFEGYLYTFTANDNSLTFKFYLSTSGSTYFFNYYETDAVIEFGNYAELKDDDSKNDKTKLTLTDELSDGKLVLVYNNDGNVIKGTFDTYTETVDGKTAIVVGRKVNAFGDENYSVTVYKFTSLDGNTTFEFTLNNGYFRICAENETFNGANGDKLELDGATHIAKYTDADGNATYSYYVWVDGVLEKDGRAVLILIGEEGAYLDVLNDTFRIRGKESGTYNIFKNGVPYGKTIELDGQGIATITNNADKTTTAATYTVNDDELTVSDKDGVLYVGKLGTITIGGTGYPAFSVLMDNIAGSYINREDLSVIVLDNAGNAVRYNSYGVGDKGYYFRIDDDLFYYINSAATFAGMYTFNRETNEIVNTGTSMTFYASDFASIVFYSTGSVKINNSEELYYVIKDGKVITYKAASDVAAADANGYGYVVDEIVIDENGKIKYTVDKKERTYTRSANLHVTFTDANGNTLEFQPDGEPTFVVSGTLTIPGKDGGEDKTLDYYVGLDYKDDGTPYVYLADQVSDYVNGGVQKFNFTRNYEIEINYDAKTFSFEQDNFITGMYAYNYMYMLYLNYYGSSYASVLNSINGLLSITCDTVGNQKTYSVSGVFNYIKNSDETAFSFTDGTLSEAGYYSSSYGHAYITEFVVNGETYHLTFFLMPPNTANGAYAYRIYTLTKVTKETVIDDAGTTICSEELVYTEFNISDGGKDSEGNDTYYKVKEPFIPSLKYQGKLLGSYLSEKTGDNAWTFYEVTFENGKLVDEIRYLFTVTYDDDGVVDGGSVEKQILLQVTTEAGDTVYAWYDGNDNVIEVVGIRFKGKEDITAPTTCQKNASGESFTLTVEGVTYTLEYTFTTGEGGERQVTVTLTAQTQESNPAA